MVRTGQETSTRTKQMTATDFKEVLTICAALAQTVGIPLLAWIAAKFIQLARAVDRMQVTLHGESGENGINELVKRIDERVDQLTVDVAKLQVSVDQK